MGTTIPVLPGPLSFLPTLAQAVSGTMAGVQSEQDDRRNQAMKKLAQTQQLVQAGVLSPSVFADPGMTQVYADAGMVQPRSTQVIPSPQEALARKITPEIQNIAPGSPQATAAAGIMQKSAAQKEKITEGVLSTVTPKSAQARSVAGVTSEPLAQAAENNKAANLALDTAVAGTASDLMQNSEFAKLSAMAKTKILGVIIARIQGKATVDAAAERYTADFITRQQQQLRQQIDTDRQQLTQITGGAMGTLLQFQLDKVKRNADGSWNLDQVDPQYQMSMGNYLRLQDEIHGLTDQLNQFNSMAAARSAPATAGQPAKAGTVNTPAPAPSGGIPAPTVPVTDKASANLYYRQLRAGGMAEAQAKMIVNSELAKATPPKK